MPMHSDFRERLFPILPEIAAHFHTPFHIYDETGIRQTGAELKRALSGIQSFKEYFAVKAQPHYSSDHEGYGIWIRLQFNCGVVLGQTGWQSRRRFNVYLQ